MVDMPTGPVVMAQVTYNPTNNTIQVAFAPFVDAPVLAAADVIKACADFVQRESLKEEGPPKPKILVPNLKLS